MRQVMLLAALALAACSNPPPPANAQPPAAAGETTIGAETGMKRLATVDSLSASCAGGVITITAGASSNSGGWGEPVLRRLGSREGVISYEVVAEAPKGGAVTMMLQMFMLKHEERDGQGAGMVRIVAAGNEMSAPTGCAKGP